MVPLEDKSEFLGLMGENGQLIVITEKDIDGNLIKNANHGLDINFEILLDAMIPTILDNVMERKELQEGEHSFLGGKLVVNIKNGKPNITTIKMKE